MNIQKKPTLAEKQAFWAEQLPNFESKYWLPDHLCFLIFDMDQGNYVVKDDLDPIYEDDANEIYHRVNTGWAMWKKAVNFTVNGAKASVVFDIDLAVQQLIGWSSAKQGVRIADLTASMGLSKAEWKTIKEQENVLSKEYKDELDQYFIHGIKINWASDCPKCASNEAVIRSTAAEALTQGYFHDGDAVECCKCGHTGEMDARGEDSDIHWHEDKETK